MLLILDKDKQQIKLEATANTPIDLERQAAADTTDQPHYAAFDFMKKNTDLLPLLELEKQLPEVKANYHKILETLSIKQNPIELPNGTTFLQQKIDKGEGEA